jgi:hypothetical protein
MRRSEKLDLFGDASLALFMSVRLRGPPPDSRSQRNSRSISTTSPATFRSASSRVVEHQRE